VISARTYVEFLDNCPDAVELAAELPCETLFLRSVDEPAAVYPAEEIADRSGLPVTISVGEFGGHYYVGHESLVAETVVEWLAPLV
jgi:hypothetical protein